jgi:two-component system invasion response regulator UvrY
MWHLHLPPTKRPTENYMIKIGIVDDHAVIRAGLREFFSSEPDFLVVGEASSGREAIDLVKATEMDVLLMDLSMPGQSGIDSLTMIRAKAPQMGVLILTGLPESQYAVNLIRQGVSGYLNKDCDPAEIAKAIRAISEGRRYISPAVAELIAQKLERKSDLPVHQQLSEREFQVFLKLAEGEKTGDIAEELHLSVKTVSTYRARVLGKMGLGSNAELTYYAIKANLIE